MIMTCTRGGLTERLRMSAICRDYSMSIKKRKGIFASRFCQAQVQIQIQSRSIPGPFQIYLSHETQSTLLGAPPFFISHKWKRAKYSV